ncbi:7387_t:CDS:1, partial [Racocetra fulgida]
NELKEQLKLKLEEDEFSSEQLQKLKDKGITFTQLWHKKLYSA